MSHAGIVVAVAGLVASALARAATRHLERRPLSATGPSWVLVGSFRRKMPETPHQNGEVCGQPDARARHRAR